MAFDLDGAREAGYSDDEIAEYLARERGFNLRGALEAGYSPVEVIDHLSTSQQKPSGFIDRLKDVGVTAAKTIVGTGEAAVGLGEIAKKVHPAARIADAAGLMPSPDDLGFRPKEAQATLESLYTPEQQAANKAVERADGVGATLSAVAQNPSVIPHKVGESIGPMLLGGGVGRVASLAKPIIGGALGEASVGAGSTAEQIRQETGDLTTGQAAIALGSGGLTGVLGVAGGRLAQKLGIGDIDSWLSGETNAQVRKGMARRVVEGAISEGLLEELPQSAQEQIAQNIALGKPWDEGVAKAATMGAVVGAAMGGGMNVIARPSTPTEMPPEDILQAQSVEDAINAAEAALDTSYTELPSETERAQERHHNVEFEPTPIPDAETRNRVPDFEGIPYDRPGALGLLDEARGVPRAMDETAAELQREPAPVNPPQIEIPGQAAPQTIPPEQTVREQYAAALEKQSRGELVSAYERVLLDNPPPTPQIEVAEGPKSRDPASMTWRELALAKNLTRSADRRAEIESEMARRDVAPGATPQTTQEATDAPALEDAAADTAVGRGVVPVDQAPGAVPEAAGSAQAQVPGEGGVDGAAVQTPPAAQEPLPTTQVQGGTAPAYRDYTAPKSVGNIVKGEVRTFKSERAVKMFAKQQGIKGYAPRQSEDGWVLSKPIRARTEAQKANDAALKGKATQVRQDDDVLTVLAKSGGMLQSEVDGADPKDLASMNKGAFGKPFTKNRGLTADGAAEVLASHGFDVLDESGRPDASKALELVHESLTGSKVYSPEGAMMRASAESQAQEAVAKAQGLPAGVERRADAAGRKRVAEMSPEEMRQELLIDRKTGIGNDRAWNEARATEPKPYVASIDADGLKWINDNMGHQHGDRLLEAIGQAIAAEGLDGYHVSGDEFLAQFESEDEAREAMQRVRDRLDEVEIVATLQDGSKATLKGVGFSYGLGQDIESAEGELKRDKSDRTDEGKRAGRGESPPGLVRESAEPARESRGEAPPERVATPEAPKTTPAPAGVSVSDIPPALLKKITVSVEQYHDGEGVKTAQVPASEALADIDSEIAAYEKLRACVAAA